MVVTYAKNWAVKKLAKCFSATARRSGMHGKSHQEARIAWIEENNRKKKEN